MPQARPIKAGARLFLRLRCQSRWVRRLSVLALSFLLEAPDDGDNVATFGTSHDSDASSKLEPTP